MDTPSEILNIYDFLLSCKYDNDALKDGTTYNSVERVDEIKKCVCFDGALYALKKIRDLGMTCLC